MGEHLPLRTLLLEHTHHNLFQLGELFALEPVPDVVVGDLALRSEVEPLVDHKVEDLTNIPNKGFSGRLCSS